MLGITLKRTIALMGLSHIAGLVQRYIAKYNNIVSGGKITSSSNLGDGLHTGTYLQRT